MTINQIENIPCQIVHAGHGLSTITFTIPDENVNGFVALLTSLSNLFRGLGWKTKTNIDAIHERESFKVEARLTRLKQFEEAVILNFTKNMESGKSPKESLSLTTASVKYVYEFASYEIVRKILTKNKYLKNTGYYKRPR